MKEGGEKKREFSLLIEIKKKTLRCITMKMKNNTHSMMLNKQNFLCDGIET